MKRILRSAMEFCMTEENKYTRDLYLSVIVFKKYYPLVPERINNALHYALNPTGDYVKL